MDSVIRAEPAKAKRGRPRKYRDNAAKQAAYRERKQEPERIRLVAEILKSMARCTRRSASDVLMGLSIRKLKQWRRVLRGRIS
jgi:hypothetical protein